MSNVKIAREVFKQNIGGERKDVIAKILEATTLNETDARVYYRRILLEHQPELAKKSTKGAKKIVDAPITKIVEDVIVVGETVVEERSVAIDNEIDDSAVPRFLKKAWAKLS